METQKINSNCTFENIQTSQRLKIKRNCLNELYINTRKNKKEQKNYLHNNLKNNLRNLTCEKLFNTELENKSNFLSLKNKYLTNTVEPKYKINFKKYYMSPQKFEYNNKIFKSVKEICKDLYESKNLDNNKRMKLREDIIYKVNHYIFSDLRKNILNPEIIDKKKKKSKLVITNKTIREKKLKSIDSNKIYLKEIVKKYNEEPDIKPISLKNSRIITFENYAQNNTKYNHPQIYILNTNSYNDKKLLPIKTQKNLDSFLELSKLIPERKIDQNEINKQIYTVYKTMKDRTETAFHIK